MSSIIFRFFRVVAGGMISLGGVYVSVIPVTGHGVERTTTSGINIIVGVVFVSLLSLLAGFVAMFISSHIKGVIRDWSVNWVVGILLVTVGAMAGRSAVADQLTTGVGGVFVGVGIGIVAISYGSCGLCAEVTIGAIAIHRAVEGLVIAALAVAGTTISVLGILILSGHTIAESIAIGLNSNLERRQIIVAISSINMVFVLATTIGASNLITNSMIPTDWIVAITAGILISLGVSEFQSELPKRLHTLPR